jgi:alanine-synthesizing transaminase
MLSRRVPHDHEPNAWSRALDGARASGRQLLDLAVMDPTFAGLGGLTASDLPALTGESVLRHEPDPRGARPARQAVAAYMRDRGVDVPPEAVTLTSSTSEGYAHLFRLLCDPGDRVLTPAPSYPLFEPLAHAEGVETAPYRIAWDGRWHLDLASVEAAAADARARAIVVVQPNHPTGSCLSADERDALVTLCARRGLALIADEVFGDFGWDGAALPTLAGEPRALTFALSGLSKVCGAPQLKAGWIVTSGPASVRDEAQRGLEWLADLFLSVGAPVQAALPRLLAGRHAWQSRVRERVAANRAALVSLVARRPALTLLEGDGGWVMVVRMPGTRTGEDWALALLEGGVAVHPGHFYDLPGESYVVLGLLAAPEVAAAAMDVFERVTAD